MDRPVLRVALELRSTPDAHIEGRIETHSARGGSGGREFSGWLELIAALESVVEAARDGTDRRDG